MKKDAAMKKDVVVNERRYHMLRPGQIVRLRKECPVAWLPVGTIEWHGVHNAVGADTLQAEGIALRCAEKVGGLVFPPLYYGEPRTEALMESTAADRAAIAAEMGLDPSNFSPEQFPFSASEQTFNYQHLLHHMLAELESLGFSVGVIVAGHYPLIDHARAAVMLFNRSSRYKKQPGMLAWAFVDYLLVRDLYPDSGDHAAGWETSHMMALHPETVDLSLLPPEGETLTGVGGSMPPQRANPEFGNETIEAAVERAVREVRNRLDHPQRYGGNGMCLDEEKSRRRD